jgi:hypothetical protein
VTNPGNMPAIYTPDAIGGPMMRISHIGEGRLVVINPLEYDPNAPAFDEGETTGRVTADIAILDGAVPLQYGGSIQKKRPHPVEFRQLPALVRGIWIQEKSMVHQIKSRIGLGVVVGRIGRGQATKGNAPWVLFDPTPADMEQAKAWLSAKAVGQWQNPEPVEVTSNGYAPAAQTQQAAPPAASPYAGDPWATPAAGPQMPPGFDPNRWAGMDAGTRQQVVDWYKSQNPPAAPPQQPQAPAAGNGGAFW